jgi:hypothetical protein
MRILYPTTLCSSTYPAISDLEVFFTIISRTITNSSDSMIQVVSTLRVGVHTGLVKLEGLLISLTVEIVVKKIL